MTQTVVGYFDTPDAAHAAEEKLAQRGIDRSALHFAAEDSAYSGSQLQHTEKHGTGGFRQFFAELFGTDDADEVGHYSEAVRRGGIVLAVDVTDEASVEPVREALLDSGAVDIDERVEQWRQSGYTGYNPESPPYSADEVARERGTVLPVIQEGIEVGKREVNKGTVRVYTRTVETPFREDVTLRDEHATIERRPVDRPASEADFDALGERSIEVREMTEKAVVNKTARVVEEVEVGKEVTERTETIEDTLRHTEVEVDRGDRGDRVSGEVASTINNLSGNVSHVGSTSSRMDSTSGNMGSTSMSDMSGASESARTGAGASLRRAFEDYEDDYRRDFTTRYGSMGGVYDEYAPAYRYGHELADDERYRDRDWASIEPEIQRDWSTRYPDSAWERFKLAIRHGWERMTGDR